MPTRWKGRPAGPSSLPPFPGARFPWQLFTTCYTSHLEANLGSWAATQKMLYALLSVRAILSRRPILEPGRTHDDSPDQPRPHLLTTRRLPERARPDRRRAPRALPRPSGGTRV